MDRKITHRLYAPVESGHDCCTGCVFEDNDLECSKHACIPEQFPEGHPLREASTFGIIWVTTQ